MDEILTPVLGHGGPQIWDLGFEKGKNWKKIQIRGNKITWRESDLGFGPESKVFIANPNLRSQIQILLLLKKMDPQPPIHPAKLEDRASQFETSYFVSLSLCFLCSSKFPVNSLHLVPFYIVLSGRPGTCGVYISYNSDTSTSTYVLAVKVYQNRSSHHPALQKICYNVFFISYNNFFYFLQQIKKLL